MNQNKVQNEKVEVPTVADMNDENYLNDILISLKSLVSNYSCVLNEASNMNYYNPYAYPPFPQAQSPPMQQNVTYFVNVPSEEVARRWNVDPNTTTRFIDENNGYLYMLNKNILSIYF